jgi:hypothetical protein
MAISYMRRGAAGHGRCDPKFRSGVTSSFADVAYLEKPVGSHPMGFFIFSVVSQIISRYPQNCKSLLKI